MHRTNSATTGKNYCRVDALCITSFASFSLLLILLDLEHGGVWCEENVVCFLTPDWGHQDPNTSPISTTKNARRSGSERLKDYLTILEFVKILQGVPKKLGS